MFSILTQLAESSEKHVRLLLQDEILDQLITRLIHDDPSVQALIFTVFSNMSENITDF